MKRKKLTVAEQIADMRQKGITFHYIEEHEAARFLKYNNYYFKLKSYGKITISIILPKRKDSI